jgi:hypothetical protein
MSPPRPKSLGGSNCRPALSRRRGSSRLGDVAGRVRKESDCAPQRLRELGFASWLIPLPGHVLLQPFCS